MRWARRKLGKKIHPDHGGRRRPMAAMAPRSRRWGITKLANTLHDKSVPLNLKYILIINICVAILVTTLCEHTDDHGGCCRSTAALWPHSRRHTALRNQNKKKKLTSLNLEKNIVIYTIMTIKDTSHRAWHLAIWPKMSRLGPTMMISTAPKWRRPQSECQEGASRFGAVKTNSTSDDDRSTGVLINRCCNC